jgi:protein-disulfide isomerase
MHKKNILFWALSIIGLGLLTWGMISLANPNQSTTSQSEITTNENSKGDPEASITIIEYSDFQCPACASYYALAKQLLEEHGDEIQFIYRNFPLTNIHPQAELAAYAAEAAGLQGKFWEMHDLLFENQAAWSNNPQAEETFIAYANELGLNTEWFINDLESKEVKNKVDDDTRKARLDSVNSTPSFFINGQKINNPRNYNQFKNDVLQFQAQ